MVKNGGEGGFVTCPAFESSTYDDSLADRLIFLNRNGEVPNLHVLHGSPHTLHTERLHIYIHSPSFNLI